VRSRLIHRDLNLARPERCGSSTSSSPPTAQFPDPLLRLPEYRMLGDGADGNADVMTLTKTVADKLPGMGDALARRRS
jgi:hypothetical protein